MNNILHILTLAAGITVTHPNPERVPPVVHTTFALRESSCVNKPPYPDGKTKAWGLFGLHLARALEAGLKPSEWGTADEHRQMEAMHVLLTRYYRDARLHHAPDALVWAANFHHDGSGSNEITEYVKKIRQDLAIVQSQ